MKLRNIGLIIVIGTMACCRPALAQDLFTQHFAFDPGAAEYSGNELSLDLFGYRASRDKGGANNNAWGPGVGLNYFVTQNFGIGLESYADAFEAPYLLDGNVLFRYPLWHTGLAPYAYAGLGRQWEHAAQWYGDLGAGAEYRFTQKTGFFADIRGVFRGERQNYSMVRFGFRFAF